MINLTCDKQWLVFGHIYLTVDDKDIVVNGSVLNDKYSHISGLQSTLLQLSRKVSPFLAGENALQVIHCLECHWIVASTIPIGENSCDVLIYDSLFTSVDQATVGLLEKLFGRKIKIAMQNIQKQAGTTDCGVFAIAISTSLACGVDPTFDQSQMRQHLITCYERNHLSMFPVKNDSL